MYNLEAIKLVEMLLDENISNIKRKEIIKRLTEIAILQSEDVKIKQEKMEQEEKDMLEKL